MVATAPSHCRRLAPLLHYEHVHFRKEIRVLGLMHMPKIEVGLGWIAPGTATHISAAPGHPARIPGIPDTLLSRKLLILEIVVPCCWTSEVPSRHSLMLKKYRLVVTFFCGVPSAKSMSSCRHRLNVVRGPAVAAPGNECHGRFDIAPRRRAVKADAHAASPVATGRAERASHPRDPRGGATHRWIR